nr:hypothetical protein [uncultured Desulfobacter sp.]
MMSAILFCRLNYTGDKIEPGDQFIIINPVYLVGVYKNLNNRQLSNKTALGYLEAKHSYKKATVAFQDEVSVGTIMTIIAPAPRIWHLFFLPDRYFIKLKPDLSRGLDIIIELNRGMEGDLDGLNAEIFNRIQ